MTSKLYYFGTCKVCKQDIETGFEEHPTSEVAQLIREDRGYQYYIDPERIYIFYGDLDRKDDGRHSTWKKFRDTLIGFLQNEYDLEVDDKSFCYTSNSGKIGSHHFSIPKLNAKAETLQKIMEKCKSSFPESEDFVDTVIYKNHWWRLPNQTIVDVRHLMKSNVANSLISSLISFRKTH